MAQGFILDGTRYEWFPLDRIQVREQIRVEHWLASPEGREFTDARTWDDILAIAEEVNSLDGWAAQLEHPQFKLSLSIAIWAAKVGAGERVSLAEAIGRWTWDSLDFWADEEPEGKGDAAP